MWTVSASTMGKSSPASIALDAKEPGRSYGYLYRGDPTRSPGHPDYIPGRDREEGDGQPQRNPKTIPDKAGRVNEYCKLRAAGKDMTDADSRKAAERTLGIGRSAGKDYEREYQRRLKQQGGPS